MYVEQVNVCNLGKVILLVIVIVVTSDILLFVPELQLLGY